MSNTSKKHRDFVTEPMGKKPVTALPGVGEVLGQRMEDAGYSRASAVLGQYLVMKGDREVFQDWMKETCGANPKQAKDCYCSLRDWTNEYL